MYFVELESCLHHMQSRKVAGWECPYCSYMPRLPFILGFSCVTAWIVDQALRHTLTLVRLHLELLVAQFCLWVIINVICWNIVKLKFVGTLISFSAIVFGQIILYLELYVSKNLVSLAKFAGLLWFFNSSN